VVCADVRKEFFITLSLVFLFHFIERFTDKCTSKLKYPRALRATVALKIRSLNPDKSPWHRHNFLHEFRQLGSLSGLWSRRSRYLSPVQIPARCFRGNGRHTTNGRATRESGLYCRW
jgi:hypothetical protein